MAKFEHDNKAKLTILSDAQVEEIHEQALAILEKFGVRFENERALQILEEHGCGVDRATQMVTFPRDVVEEAVRTAPSTFEMYGPSGALRLELGRGNTYFAPGPGAPSIDAADGQRRNATTHDLEVACRIAQSSKYLDFLDGSAVPCDTPVDLNDIYILYKCAIEGDKPINAEAWTDASAANVCALLEAVCGSREAAIAKPFAMLAACPAPPRKWEGRVIDASLTAIQYGVPIYVCPSPIMGVSAPVTVAGGVLEHTIEALSYVTFLQLARPGTPVFYGGICGTLDMRSTYSTQSAIEAALCVSGFAAMGRYYDIPLLAFLAQTDSKLPDYQAGFETCMGAMTSMLSGIDVVLGAGTVDSYAATCNEKLAMDSELFGYLKMFSAGIEWDEESLGTEEIEEVGCGDDETFLERDFTFDWYREAQFIPDGVIERDPYDKWASKGTTIEQRAAAVVADAANREPVQGADVAARAHDALAAMAARTGADFGDLL